MTRSGYWFGTVGLLAVTCVWFTASQADDETTAPPVKDAAVVDSNLKDSPGGELVAQLVARIEKLEKRIATLETALENSTRQVNAVDHSSGIKWQQPNQIGPDGKPIVPSPQPQKSEWPPVRIRMLKTTVIK